MSYCDKQDGDALADSEDTTLFVERMSREHRTLQQTFTRLCIKWLQHLSQTEHYDLRNEASVEFAKSIKRELDNAAIPFI